MLRSGLVVTETQKSEQRQENNTEEQRKHPTASHLGGYSWGQKLWQEHSGSPKAATSREAGSSHLSRPKTSGGSQDAAANGMSRKKPCEYQTQEMSSKNESRLSRCN